MRLCRGLCNVPSAPLGRVLTIGNFDGVHIGHQSILKRLIEESDRVHALASVLIFEPQPMEYFLGEQAPARLMRWHDKWDALRCAGVSEVIVLRFNESLRTLSAERFVREILGRALNTKTVLLGDDFRFGCDRQGDFQFLSRLGQELNIHVQDSGSIQVADRRVSSTLLRKALQSGNFQQVKQYLGHYYGLSGKVVQGDQLGRTLGVPTANILLRRQVSPLYGVYVVRVLWQEQWYQGVANVGSRPTLAGTQARIEVHIFDFHETIYGHRIYVEFLDKIRNEQKFASLLELTAAIALDIQRAKQWWVVNKIV